MDYKEKVLGEACSATPNKQSDIVHEERLALSDSERRVILEKLIESPGAHYFAICQDLPKLLDKWGTVEALLGEIKRAAVNPSHEPVPPHLRGPRVNVKAIKKALAAQKPDGYVLTIQARINGRKAKEGLLLSLTEDGAYESIYQTTDIPIPARIVGKDEVERTTDLLYNPIEEYGDAKYVSVADSWIAALSNAEIIGSGEPGYSWKY